MIRQGTWLERRLFAPAEQFQGAWIVRPVHFCLLQLRRLVNDSRLERSVFFFHFDHRLPTEIYYTKKALPEPLRI